MGVERILSRESSQKCDVCALPIANGTKSFAEHHMDHDWLFCSPACTLAFFKNPEQYLPVEEEEG